MAYGWKKQASAACGYSMARLALRAYMYLEDFVRTDRTASEDPPGDALPDRQETDRQFVELMEAYLNGELSEEMLGALRGSLEGRMEAVIAYADCFRNYEYAWNRMERRFITDMQPTGMSDEDMVRALMGYLAAGKEAAIVNQRIQMVIGQLPVRFTRQKYYGMLREALTAYIGADIEGLEQMMYLLRTGTMAELAKVRQDSDPKLRYWLESLQAIVLRDATLPQYQEAQEKIRQASEYIVASSEYLQRMQDMVNDLYVLFLTREDAVRDAGEETHANRIFSGLCQVYRENGRAVPEEITGELPYLEGVQEEFFEKYERLEPVPAFCGGEDPAARKGRMVERLLSSSTFARLTDEAERGTVTAEMVEKALDDLIARVEPVFAASQKPVVRAIMASTLSCLPVCFNSMEEIRTYIEGSLGSCADFAEKETCKELLLLMMENDGYAVV